MKLLLTLSILALSFSCSQTSSSPITGEDEATLRDFKTVLWSKAYSEQDTALLNSLLHTDFQMTDDNGDKYSKQDEITYISNYGPSYDEFSFEVTGLNIFENGTAVISGTGTMKGVETGEAYITTYKSTDALIKVDGQWKAISSHVSGVKEERFPMAPVGE